MKTVDLLDCSRTICISAMIVRCVTNGSRVEVIWTITDIKCNLGLQTYRRTYKYNTKNSNHWSYRLAVRKSCWNSQYDDVWLTYLWLQIKFQYMSTWCLMIVIYKKWDLITYFQFRCDDSWCHHNDNRRLSDSRYWQGSASFLLAVY